MENRTLRRQTLLHVGLKERPRVIKSVNNPFRNMEGGWRWWGYGGEETMRGHHLWRDVSEINKLRESAARKEKQRLAVGVESETAGTNDCEPRTR